MTTTTDTGLKALYARVYGRSNLRWPAVVAHTNNCSHSRR